MTKRLLLMLILTGVVFGAVFGMRAFMGKQMETFEMPVPPATITSARAAQMSWDNSYETVGSFMPVNGTDVTTEVGGIVQAIHFESGGHVEAGAPLLELDAGNEIGELRRLQAQAQLAELNRARREQLVGTQVVSKSDYDAAVAEAAAAKAAVEAQQAKVAQKQIRAPFAGALGIRRVNLGQYLAPGTAIVTLQSLNPINVDFSLPEQYLGAVSAGLTATLQVDAYPGEGFKATILAVEPRVDTATRNFNVRARLSNPQGRLRAGMFARVQLRLPGSQNVVAVPRTAISHNSYGTSVFVVEKLDKPLPPVPAMGGGAPIPGTDLGVAQRFVKIGNTRGDFVAVLDGLKSGDEVATSGLLKLRNGQPVLLKNDQRPDAQLNPHPPEG